MKKGLSLARKPLCRFSLSRIFAALVTVAAVASVRAAAATSIIPVAPTATAVKPAATATATTELAAALRPLLTWTRFVYGQSPTEKLLSIEALDRRIHLLRCAHRDKREPARTAGFTIFHDEDICYSSVGLKKLAEILVSCIVGQVAYIHFGIHFSLSLNQPTCFIALGSAYRRKSPQ